MSVNTVLKGHDLFQALNVEETNKLSGFSSVRKLKAGDSVYEFGKPATHTYVLLKGAVDLQLPAGPEGIALLVSKVALGELFGLAPLLAAKRYTLAAVCKTDAEVLFIEAKPFRELLRKNHNAGFDIVNQVAHIYFTRYVEVLKRLQGVVAQIAQV